VTAILKHHVYPGALPGCLFNIYVKLAFSNGTTTKNSYVPAQPLLGSEVLLTYLETKDGSRLIRHIPPSWAGLHRGPAAALESQEADAPPAPARRRVAAHTVRTKFEAQAAEEAMPRVCGGEGRGADEAAAVAKGSNAERASSVEGRSAGRGGGRGVRRDACYSSMKGDSEAAAAAATATPVTVTEESKPRVRPSVTLVAVAEPGRLFNGVAIDFFADAAEQGAEVCGVFGCPLPLHHQHYNGPKEHQVPQTLGKRRQREKSSV